MFKKLDRSDEATLRKWMLKHDPDLALHSQLRDYFLADTDRFGAMAYLEAESMIAAVCLFTKLPDRSLVHQYFGPDDLLPKFLENFEKPTQIFLREEQRALNEKHWKVVLEVVPGFVTDHDAYDGVFSRVTPRFKGRVYESR